MNKSIALNAASRRDPTKTLTLRSAFMKDAIRRFKALKKQIWAMVVNQDGFGLDDPPSSPTPSATTVFGDRRPITKKNARAFAFARSEDKIKAFMEWLNGMERKGILEVVTRPGTKVGIDSAWTDKYIRTAYKKGIQRARTEVKKAGGEVPSLEQWPVSAAFNQPIHMDRVGVLYTRTFSELRGIDDEMDKQISRVLSEGLIEGKNPKEIARDINNRIDKIGITRARTLARTEIIRAHHIGSITEYEQYQIQGVNVQAEWLTAGDGRVCPICAALQGKVFTLKEIKPMIPHHPNCRCVAIPAGIGEEN